VDGNRIKFMTACQKPVWAADRADSESLNGRIWRIQSSWSR
jgi:hypothetical protein